MNILFLIGSFCDFGGTERYVAALANALSSRGHSVGIASFRGHNNPDRFAVSKSVRVYELGRHPTNELRHILMAGNVNVIVNNWCLPFYVTVTIDMARKGLGCCLVSYLHGMPDRCRRVIVAEDVLKACTNELGRLFARARLWAINAIVKASIRFVYRRSDAYVLLSDRFKDSFQRYTGIDDNGKLRAIGCPITIATDYQTNWLNVKKHQILYVGRMDKENKRVNRIVEVWEELCRSYGDAGDIESWELILVGGGPHLEELRQYVEEQKVPRVTFTGFVSEDPVRYYADASIFVLTSDLEGFAMVLAEAMSYGVVPIVYGSYPTVRDIIDDGENGFITSYPYSHDETVARVRDLMRDDMLRRRMAISAIEKSKLFTLETISEKWEGMLSQYA